MRFKWLVPILVLAAFFPSAAAAQPSVSLPNEFRSPSYSFGFPDDWVVERNLGMVSVATSQVALRRARVGGLGDGDSVVQLGFFPAAWLAMETWFGGVVEVAASKDVLLASIVPLLRLTPDYAADAVVGEAELVSLGNGREAGLLIVSSDDKQGMLIVFEPADGVIGFVSAAGTGDASGLRDTGLAIAASVDYLGSADALVDEIDAEGN